MSQVPRSMTGPRAVGNFEAHGNIKKMCFLILIVQISG